MLLVNLLTFLVKVNSVINKLAELFFAFYIKYLSNNIIIKLINSFGNQLTKTFRTLMLLENILTFLVKVNSFNQKLIAFFYLHFILSSFIIINVINSGLL